MLLSCETINISEYSRVSFNYIHLSLPSTLRAAPALYLSALRSSYVHVYLNWTQREPCAITVSLVLFEQLVYSRNSKGVICVCVCVCVCVCRCVCVCVCVCVWVWERERERQRDRDREVTLLVLSMCHSPWCVVYSLYSDYEGTAILFKSVLYNMLLWKERVLKVKLGLIKTYQLLKLPHSIIERFLGLIIVKSLN